MYLDRRAVLLYSDLPHTVIDNSGGLRNISMETVVPVLLAVPKQYTLTP